MKGFILKAEGTARHFFCSYVKGTMQYTDDRDCAWFTTHHDTAIAMALDLAIRAKENFEIFPYGHPWKGDPPVMFHANINYRVRRRVQRGKARIETGRVSLVIHANDLADAQQKARDWFEKESTSRTAHITFGTGIRDAVDQANLSEAINVTVIAGDIMVL